jgi:phosphatidylglycerol---prolipoprotein diacylglyceryl transferase
MLTDTAFLSARTLPPLRSSIVFVLYVAVFCGFLPALLWELGGHLDLVLGLPAVEGSAVRAGGTLLAVLGVIGMGWSVLVFRLVGLGWPMSHLPPRRLVARGPYRFLRHPIYAGFVGTLGGSGLATGSVGRGLLMAALAALGWFIYARGFEEPRLLRRYGEQYLECTSGTPLLPRVIRVWLARAGGEVWTRAIPSLEWLANRTVLFRLGPAVWVTFGLFAGVAASLLAAMLAKLLAADGIAVPLIAGYLVLLTVAVPLGARICWIGYQWRCVRRDPRIALSQVGFVSWGGLAAVLVAAPAFATWNGIAPLWLLDRTIFASLAGYAIGRLGCLTYGCCYGRPWSPGIRWYDPTAKVIREHGPSGAVRRVPTQLLSSISALGITGLLAAATYRPSPAGTVAGLGLLMYGASRAGIECLRADPRYSAVGLTSGQVGSLAALGLGVALLLHAGGPPGWTHPAGDAFLAPGLPVWPVVAVCGLLVSVVDGLHWRRVGSW